MAKADFKMPEEFLLKLSTLADKTDEIVPRVLEEGAKVVESNVRSRLSAIVGKGTKYPSRSSGQLLSSLGTSKALLDKNGNYNVKIGFAENRSDGESNAKLASILEYGKSGQPPRPFLKPAKTASRGACVQAMKQKLDEEINSI